jgi:hypothetical protein
VNPNVLVIICGFAPRASDAGDSTMIAYRHDHRHHLINRTLANFVVLDPEVSVP